MSGSVSSLSTAWTHRDDKWAHHWMDMAMLVASWSKDPSTCVGSIIVNGNNHIVSSGYNGLPTTLLDDHLHLSREAKLQMTVHAEANALLQAGRRASGCELYSTHPPCAGCMSMIINCRVASVTCLHPTEDYMSRWSESVGMSEEMALVAGIGLSYVEKDSGPTDR